MADCIVQSNKMGGEEENPNGITGLHLLQIRGFGAVFKDFESGLDGW